MTVLKFDVLGSPEVGNYGVASNKYVIIIDELSQRKMERVRGVLRTEVIGVRLTNCRIIRPLMVGNSHGVAISKIVDDETVRRVRNGLEGVRVEVVESKYTALGNLVSVNDKGGIASPLLSKEDVKKLEDVFDVEIVQMGINNRSYVGSLLKVNNKGGLVTPYAKDEEMKLAREVLGVNIHRGTINSGAPFISSGIIVNDFGALVGELTDGMELVNISEAFGVG